jgi:hypothetical protein
VWVAHVRHRHRFLSEATYHALAGEKRGGHHLDRDFAVEGYLVREVNGRHTPAAELTENLELTRRGRAKASGDLRPGIRLFGTRLVSRGNGALGARACASSASRAETIGSAQWGAAPFTAGHGCGRSAKRAETIARPDTFTASAARDTGRLRGTTCHAAATGV